MSNIIDMKRNTQSMSGRNDEILNITKYMSIKTIKGFALWMGCMTFIAYTILKVSGLL